MGKRILILSNHFITLFNFRKELIMKLVEDEHDVFIAMPKSDENHFFMDMGCKIVEVPIDRRGVNPISDLGLIFSYIRIMKQLRPDIVFSYTIKPNIYGCIASNITNCRQISNITGTGATFLKKDVVSSIVKMLYKLSIKRSYKVFFQNSGDKDFFVKNRLVKKNFGMLPGSGVNLEQYSMTGMPDSDEINFIFMGRVMKLKGIDQYLACAKTIKAKYANTHFYVAGFLEEDSYQKIIGDYNERGIIKYIGFQKDIKSWIKKCHCVILPSFGGEGIPNVLLESAAMGRVCIASNVNGSKDVVDDGITGYLFKAGNSDDLIAKVEQFMQLSDDERCRMGLLGRAKVEKQFDRRIVIESYLNELRKVERKRA